MILSFKQIEGVEDIMKWNTPKQLQDLLCEVVSWHSRTGTEGEISFPYKLGDKLLEQDYFKNNPSNIQLHDAGEDRNALTALYHSGITNKTIVLISHFDTVHTEEFGTLGDLAFQPKELTAAMKDIIDELPEDAQEDLKSDEFLFGRGTMDMKMGLVLHLHLLELAANEKWPINLLLVTVPDEEVNSAGMRAAVDGLIHVRESHNLSYELFLNSEPSFSQTPRDDNYYIYSGTIGKIMPSALFYGRETHAGEPLNGMTGHYMASYFTKEMEFNPAFSEEVYGEKTPLPICLKSYDLKRDYSTQTSNHSAALYNVFLMEKSAEDVMNTFKSVAENTMKTCQNDYETICSREGVDPIGEIKVLEYAELETYAIEKLGNETVSKIKQDVMSNLELDEREMSIQICDQFMLNCQELAPATVVFFAPPYYPAINSSENSLVQEKIRFTQDLLKKAFDVDAKQVHYFNGISDLSYVNYDQHDEGWKAYMHNTPVWGDVYSIPFKSMQQLQAPVINIGPFGKDAHKLTERLHKQSAFVYTPHALKQVIETMFSKVY